MKRKPRFNNARWEFEKFPCPYCGRMLKRNWYMRHVKSKHPEVLRRVSTS